MNKPQKVLNWEIADNRPNLNWRQVTSNNDFQKLREEWERLFFSNKLHSPFLAWGWIAAWRSHLARSHNLNLQILEDNSGQIYFLAPLIETNIDKSNSQSRITNLCGYGPDCADHLGFLYRPELASQTVELFCYCLRNFISSEARIELCSMGGEDWLISEIRSTLRKDGRHARVSRRSLSPRIELPDSWDKLLQNLSKNFRAQVRRNVKSVQNNPDLELRSIPTAEAAWFTDNLIRLNRIRMKETGRISSLEDKNFREFLKEAIQYMADSGLAWMDTIQRDDQVVAASLNLVSGQTIYYYMGGFDAEIRSIGPGNALFARAMQRGIDNHFRHFDFLRGDEAYKYRWGAKDVIDTSLSVYSRGYISTGCELLLDATKATLTRMNRKLRTMRSS